MRIRATERKQERERERKREKERDSLRYVEKKKWLCESCKIWSTAIVEVRRNISELILWPNHEREHNEEFDQEIDFLNIFAKHGRKVSKRARNFDI